jgi:hypothetical protein
VGKSFLQQTTFLVGTNETSGQMHGKWSGEHVSVWNRRPDGYVTSKEKTVWTNERC